MYLHLGQGSVVPRSDVIGIFDLDNTTGSTITRRFLGEAEKSGRVVDVSGELPNAFIVCDGMKVYLSQLTSQTLARRFETMRFD